MAIPDAVPPAEPAPLIITATPPVRLPSVRLLDASRLPPFEGERRVLAEAQLVATLDRTAPTEDLWQRLRRGFAMADIRSPQVDERTRWYVANQEYLQRVFERSKRYLFHIVEALEKRNLPTELALVPMFESAFNPMAYSRSHASGLWQFIPGTGKRYELTQNMWYDGRRDVVASTDAALDYLRDLYEMHGDWHLALASYNWGENNVARAIARNRKEGKPTDYLSLPMPRETRGYVPKLQALKNLIANPAAYGIALAPIPNEPYFATVTKTRDIDVKLAAELAEMSVEDFVNLNPGFSRPVIRSAVAARIVLPADKVDTFHDNLEKLADADLVSWKTYKPKRGDTLESIARQHRMSLAQLREVNGISPRARRMPEVLVVPIEGGAESFARLPIMYAPPIPSGGRTHVVRRGETAWGIARRYGVSVKDLQRWNRIGKHLMAGQRLTIF
ncbi:MAG: transglycosylase SLT domain-containing protein [Betaproteobacteria bacterium]|nr:transglycosylase SLT domain-containing protein [Betaproteobacteria bacterium]